MISNDTGRTATREGWRSARLCGHMHSGRADRCEEPLSHQQGVSSARQALLGRQALGGNCLNSRTREEHDYEHEHETERRSTRTLAHGSRWGYDSALRTPHSALFSKESPMALRCHPVGNENFVLVLVLLTGESMSTITSTSTRRSATAAALLTPVS
jgi:hypothetical protein